MGIEISSGFGKVADLINNISDKLWPDPNEKAKNLLAVKELEQRGEFKEIDAALQYAEMQTKVNAIEAASDVIWKSGWRPFIGWVCGTALAWHYIGSRVAAWILALKGIDIPLPEVDLGDLIVILFGMLGLGKLRTDEKMKGVAK